MTDFLEPLPKADDAIIQNRLTSLGYVGKLAETIKKFQAFNGLKDDGDCGPITSQLLLYAPRCGCDDVQRSGLCRFPHKDVRWWHDMSFSGLSSEEVQRAYKAAWKVWNNVCGLAAIETGSKSLANVYAHARRIDGGGGTLAWSYLSCGADEDTQLEQRYDTSESWGYRSFRRVAIHEIGHALGFDHSPNRSSIMYAYSNADVNELSAEDIQGAIKRYGENTNPTPPIPPTPPDNGPVITGEIGIDGIPYWLVKKIDYNP